MSNLLFNLKKRYNSKAVKCITRDKLSFPSVSFSKNITEDCQDVVVNALCFLGVDGRGFDDIYNLEHLHPLLYEEFRSFLDVLVNNFYDLSFYSWSTFDYFEYYKKEVGFFSGVRERDILNVFMFLFNGAEVSVDAKKHTMIKCFQQINIGATSIVSNSITLGGSVPLKGKIICVCVVYENYPLFLDALSKSELHNKLKKIISQFSTSGVTFEVVFSYKEEKPGLTLGCGARVGTLQMKSKSKKLIFYS